MADYTIFYCCNDNSGPYYVSGTNYSGVYFYGWDYRWYRVDHYSNEPEGWELDGSALYYWGSQCPAYSIFYRCRDNAGPYYVNNLGFAGYGGAWLYTDGQYYRVSHASPHAEGSPLSASGLSYYGPDCPIYTIFYRCSDNAGPYYADVNMGPYVYYYENDGQYYRFDHYSHDPEGSFLPYWRLSYYGSACPGGPSFNPAWALYTNSYVGIGHV